MPAVQYSYFAFAGGLDQVSPPLQIKPGVVRSASNFECRAMGGYRRIKGYERYSGKTAPSAGQFALLYATITGSYAVGDTLTGASSGATGVILAAVETGASYFILTAITGTYTDGENLQIAASTIAVADDPAATDFAPTSALRAAYRNLAADYYRALISAPAGSGAILGGFLYQGTNYCFRNNVGATAAVLFKSTASGWSSVALGRELSFTSGGTTAIAEGNTITGATSGATAVITRVVLESGTWAGGDAAGRFIFASQTGTFQAENLNVGASLNLATIAGNSSAITLAPSGRYECKQHNFGGGTATKRVYGCDGANRAFEFDGTVFVPIRTGMTTDTPNHLSIHKQHLFLSFPGGSVQHSGPGEPYAFTIITGAGEIAIGDDCTGMLSMPGDSSTGSLLLLARNNTKVLYGTSADNWNLVSYADEAGSVEWTAQMLSSALWLDDRGITNLYATANFGNFADSSISGSVRPTLFDLITSAIASSVVREKNQYRLFFSGGDALYLTFDKNKLIGIMPVTFTDPVACTWAGEDSEGREASFFGGSDGMVYQFEKGTSFDGDPIPYRLELAYHHIGSPRIRKAFRKMAIEVTGESYAEFGVSTSLSYGSTDVETNPEESITTNLTEANWDSVSWDQFLWDGKTLIPSEVSLSGTAENISIIVAGESDEVDSFTLAGAIIHFIMRRGIR